MTRPLLPIDAGDPLAVHAALRAALTGDGPAVLPRQHATEPLDAETPRAQAPHAKAPDAAEPDAEEAGAPLPASVPRNVALVVETSGSTGVPKRVALSADALLASAAASAGAIGGQDPGTSRWLLALPVHYIAGANVLVRSIAAGTDPVVLPPGHFDPAAFCSAAETLDSDVRLTSLVPVQLARLLDHAKALPAAGRESALRILRRFDALLIGGQALQPALRRRALDAGLRVVRTYGASETGGGCVYDGVPLGTVHARCGEGSTGGSAVGGPLELAGPVLAEGYLAADGTIDRERTDAVFHTVDGVRWYRTGDLGTVDADGRVAVSGRADNVIVSGGEKVSLDAVQASVRRRPGYGDAVVIAAESAEWGQVPVVVAARSSEARDPARDDLVALRAAVQSDLGRAAAPARVVVVDALPLLASGKPDRVALARIVAERGPCEPGDRRDA